MPRSPWRGLGRMHEQRRRAGGSEGGGDLARRHAPDLPMPVTTTRPAIPASASTASVKLPSSAAARARRPATSVPSTARATSRSSRAVTTAAVIGFRFLEVGTKSRLVWRPGQVGSTFPQLRSASWTKTVPSIPKSVSASVRRTEESGCELPGVSCPGWNIRISSSSGYSDGVSHCASPIVPHGSRDLSMLLIRLSAAV